MDIGCICWSMGRLPWATLLKTLAFFSSHHQLLSVEPCGVFPSPQLGFLPASCYLLCLFGCKVICYYADHCNLTLLFYVFISIHSFMYIILDFIVTFWSVYRIYFYHIHLSIPSLIPHSPPFTMISFLLSDSPGSLPMSFILVYWGYFTGLGWGVVYRSRDNLPVVTGLKKMSLLPYQPLTV